MIVVDIDELTPCLVDTVTGDILETECIAIKRTSFLKKFNRKNGWYVSWAELAKQNDIYALVLKGTVDIQGLLAVRNDRDLNMAYIAWMVAAPQNNPQITEQKKYTGVGGHLFAIAIDKSIDYGHNGELTGFAANAELEQHYVDMFHAEKIEMLHPYQIYISSGNAMKIKEAYTYDWTDDEL